MIINYPTGLYKNVLPDGPDDSQNVTFLISNTAPPKASLLFPKIPIGIANRKRAPDGLTPEKRRLTVGPLVFTISRASRNLTGNNAQQYEIGSVLDFSYSSIKQTDPMLVSTKTEIQHNLNLYDYAELGLTEDDVELINEQSITTFDIITNRLNYLRIKRSDAEVRINTTQKLINEANKNIAALEVMTESVGTDPDIDNLLVKLRKKLAEAEITMSQAVIDANTAAAEAAEELQNLRTVGMVLK